MYIMLNKKKTIMGGMLVLVIVIGMLCWWGLHLRHQPQEAISWQMADQIIVIDPGHGGIFPGKVSSDGVLEKEINLAIAQKLQALLTESGCITVMTRESDKDLVPQSEQDSKMILRQRADLDARTNVASASQADLFVSIHCNSIPSVQWSGAQTFYASDNEQSAQLAQSIQQALKNQLKNTEREAIVREDTYLFKHLDIPAVIVECGFLSNTDETALLQQEAYQQKIAYAIFCGISDYLDQSTAPGQ